MSHRLKLKNKAPLVQREYCTKCGQYGHIHQNCGMGITCYKCGKVGHHGRDCTEDIVHASVAVQSAVEHGKMQEDQYGEKKETSHITDWKERAKADREIDEQNRSRVLTEADYLQRESKTYDLLPQDDVTLHRAKKDAKRRKRERKEAERQRDLEALEELREKKRRLDEEDRRLAEAPPPERRRRRRRREGSTPPHSRNTPAAEDAAAEPQPEAPAAPAAPAPRPSDAPLGREQQLLAEKQRRAEEARMQKEAQQGEEEAKLDRIVQRKMRKQADHFAPPAWVSRRRDRHLILAVEKDGSTVESLDVSTHPYYLLGKSEAVVDFPQSHPSVSRVHVAILHNGAEGVTYVQDLGSQWGTKLDGKKIPPKTPVRLGLNSKVHLGASTRCIVLKEKAEW